MKNNPFLMSLDGDWTIEGMEPYEGLSKKAYEPAYVPQKPVKARVPGIVQNALLEAGKIEDPYFEDNVSKILWVENKEWWFFRDFIVPRKKGWKNFRLEFEGITYRGEVWLNGITLGVVEGMFLRHCFDITRLVKPGMTCRIALRLRTLEGSSEDRPGGKVVRGMVRSTGVVAPFSYWWNWSPHLVPVGIWKSVRLRGDGGARVDNPYVRTKIEWKNRSALIKVEAEIASGFNTRKGLVLRGVINGNPEIRFSIKSPLAPGEKRIVKFRPVRMRKPRLWWPNGLGDHPTYRLTLRLEDGRGNMLDTAETVFGVREVKLIRNFRDEWVQKVHGQSNRLWSIVGKPYAWTFVVNRKRIFIKGSNWLPHDSLFRLTQERYRLFLDQAEAAKFNMLRVWAGGIHETEDFYRQCDEKGILLWTDFWLSCASYPAMPHDLFIRCAKDMIRVLRNHPSLVMWCGGNEYNPDEPENKELVDKMDAAVRECDPSRPFRRGSPYRGNRHGGLLMLPTRTSNKYNGDILSGPSRLVLLRSEVAVMRSAPLLKSIRKFIGAKNLWPINKKAWQSHHAVIQEQERDALEYGGEKDLSHWLMSGQIAHGQVHRHNLEYCRQSKYLCSGCLQWQINGSWPSFHRELIDWYGLPKPAFYAYKRAAADTLIVLDMEKYLWDANEAFLAHVYAVNDLYEDLKGLTAKAAIYDLDMNRLHSKVKSFKVNADSSRRAFTIKWRIPSGLTEKVFIVHLSLFQGNRLLSENLYWAGISAYCRPKKLMNLDGPWKLRAGAEEWKKILLPSYWKKPPEPPPEGRSLFYRREVRIPVAWKGEPLEFFCAGLEGNDEVFWNGKRIGGTAEEVAVQMGTDARVFAGAAAKDGKLRNVRVSSDPFTVPNLIKRFYPIPAESVRFGKNNLLEIRLYGKHAIGISEPVFVRSASSPAVQKAVVDFENRRAFLSGFRGLPAVTLTGEVSERALRIKPGRSANFAVRLKNPSSRLAFFTGVDLEGLDNQCTAILSDNYFALLPGQSKRIRVRLVHNQGFQGNIPLQVRVAGWNVKRGLIGKGTRISLL